MIMLQAQTLHMQARGAWKGVCRCSKIHCPLPAQQPLQAAASSGVLSLLMWLLQMVLWLLAQDTRLVPYGT
jgi:hypothetical protein